MAKYQVKLSFLSHITIGIAIRLILILYSDIHDEKYRVQYTDVDYRVFTDAASHVLEGRSPYNRHTYRYSPILAYLMIPNILLWKNFGKALFSFFDILITIVIKYMVNNQLGSTRPASKVSVYSSLFWLYSPLTIAISTRGNADSVPSFLIILSLFFLQSSVSKLGLVNYALSGALLGLSIHLRIYPIVFTLPMFLSIGDYSKINRRTTFFEGLWIMLPNRNQIVLTLSCIATLFGSIYVFFQAYGNEFMFETYIYHFIRKDTRHNFSMMFYHLYLSSEDTTIDLMKISVQIFELMVLLGLSFVFGSNSRTLSFALFGQAVILVANNSVVTSQYFIWFLSLFPLIVHDIKMKQSKAIILVLMWFGAQASWLYYAYLLEFQGKSVFFEIWMNGVIFFSVNMYILVVLMTCYSPGYGFGYMVYNRDKKKYK